MDRDNHQLRHLVSALSDSWSSDRTKQTACFVSEPAIVVTDDTAVATTDYLLVELTPHGGDALTRTSELGVPASGLYAIRDAGRFRDEFLRADAGWEHTSRSVLSTTEHS